jgi:fructokinase
MSTLFGAVEAGGTKFICAVGEDPAAPRDIRRISTSHNPVETLAEVIGYFRQHQVAAIGISSFGPIDYSRGCIANTPKPGWKDFPVKGALERAFPVPVAFETDVNGAAVGEARYGAGRGAANFVYFTVGTGIGGGAIAGGQPVRGLLHPEMGHILVRRHPEDPASFTGACPFHGDCLEGMASGPAMAARWGQAAHLLPAGHPAWRIQAEYLAQACSTVTYVLSPQSIVLGGGVMAQQHLFPLIRERLSELLNGYLDAPAILPPELPLPAITGALALAADLLHSR